MATVDSTVCGDQAHGRSLLDMSAEQHCDHVVPQPTCGREVQGKLSYRNVRVVKSTLNPPVPVLKAGHPVPTALLMNISAGKCVCCGVLVELFQFIQYIFISEQ